MGVPDRYKGRAVRGHHPCQESGVGKINKLSPEFWEFLSGIPGIPKLLEDFLEPIAKAASDDTYLDKSWSHGKSRWID